MGLPRRILVPVDFSASSDRACDYAAELAAALGAELTLLQVIERPPYVLPREVDDALQAAVEAALDRRAAALRPYVVRVRTMTADGRPADEIAKTAETELPDLLVLGTHGRRGVLRAALGSVAERVVRLSSVPVLTVPGHAFVDRRNAASRLLPLVASAGLASAAFFALSRSALPLAAELAGTCEGTLDVWVTAPIEVDGRVVGCIGEDEKPVLDRALPAETIAAARESLRREIERIRGTRGPGEVWNRTVVLVSDGLDHAAPVASAARALRSEQPSEIVLVTPIATRSALVSVAAEVDRCVCLERVVVGASPACRYRDDHVPSDAEARRFLDEFPREAHPEVRVAPAPSARPA